VVQVAPTSAAQPDTVMRLFDRAAPRSPGPASQHTQEVWVGAAVTRQPQRREVTAVAEWTLEPVLCGGGLSLTLALDDGRTAQCFLLSPEDAQDIAAAIAHLQGDSAA